MIIATASLLLSAVDSAIAVVPVPGGPITVVPVTINASAGDQYDPHVDGDLAAYSEVSSNARQIRYYNFITGVDTAISNVFLCSVGLCAASDLLSDVQGGRIVFTRINSWSNAIMLFDPAAVPALTEVNAQADSNRIGVAIGGPTLAYTDFGLESGGEIVAVDLANGNATTRLTDDVAVDQNVAVSPDGMVIVWERCEGAMLLCDVFQAVTSAGSWAVSPVTSTPTFAEESPDTNGSLVVYMSNRGAGSYLYDLFYRSVAGGAERHLQMPGDQLHPSIAAGVIAFESTVGGGASDLYLYELSTNRVFQLTATPMLNESLNDVKVLANGDVRVVWDRDDEVIARNVYGATFTLPPPGPPPVCGNGVLDPGEQCDDGNTANGDGCSATCQTEPPPPVCGNGVLDPGEQCDDGNTANGDGCSSTCQSEPPPPPNPDTVETDNTWLLIAPVGDLSGQPINNVGLGWEDIHTGWNTNSTYDTSSWGTPVSYGDIWGHGYSAYWAPGHLSPVYLRKIVNLPAVQQAFLSGGADDDIQIYINGTLVLNDHNGTAAGFGPIDVTQYLVPGSNLLAAKAHDSFGGVDGYYFTIAWTVAPPNPDTTPPTIALTCPATANLRATAYASVKVSDLESGVGSQSAPDGDSPLDTSTVGTHTFTVTATDIAGNSGSSSCTYRVIYDFQGAGGFGPPVANPPDTNTVRAGSTVPVKWQLPDGQGGYVSVLGVVTSLTTQEVLCLDLSSSTNEVPASTSGNSGLHYDATTHQFIYNWKTDRSMAGKCYVFFLRLNDGSVHHANFSLE